MQWICSEVKEKLQSKCKDKIFDTQKEASEDFAADAMLSELCTDDAQVLCEDVKAGGGRVQACLRTKRPQLSWDCQEELFRKEVEDADDLRLNPTLLRLCSKDKKKFCGGACVGGVFACERRAALLTHQQGGLLVRRVARTPTLHTVKQTAALQACPMQCTAGRAWHPAARVVSAACGHLTIGVVSTCGVV